MNDISILESAILKVKKYISENETNKQPVINYKSPQEIKQVVDFKIDNSGVNEDQFLQLIDNFLSYSVRTGHKQFINQLYAGFNFPAFMGEVLTALTTTSMVTYEVAPMATLIEVEMIDLLKKYTGYDIENSDGIFLTGGSNANLVAMMSARNRYFPEGRFKGYDRNQKLVGFVNEQAHYSFDTAANVIGIGSDNIIRVAADANGKMKMDALVAAIEKAIADGCKPFFMGATCGTTMMAAFDPVNEMAVIAEKYDMWLHADGSLGGSLLLSKKHKYLLEGVHKADSFGWNPHKMMNIPLPCSALMVKKKGTLHSNLTDMNTDYLYHDSESIEDLGLKSIQCGRRADAVKLWFAWKYFGLDGYEARIENQIAMAEYIANKVMNTPKMEQIGERQSISVCFRYTPSADQNVNEFNKQIREELRKSGKVLINYGYINEQLVLRFNTSNGAISKEDIDEFFDYLNEAIRKVEGRFQSN